MKNKELNRIKEGLRSMMDSCFVYGGIDKDNYNYKRYILPYQEQLRESIFNEIFEEHSKYLQQCTIKFNVYEDCEGLSYNSLQHPL